MKKLLGIMVLGLLWCNISIAKDITAIGFINGMETKNEEIIRYIKGYLKGAYSGFLMSQVELNEKVFCVPGELILNEENLVSMVDEQIKIYKKINVYRDDFPVTFFLMDSLKRVFPCQE